VNKHVLFRFLQGSEAKQVTKSRYVCTPATAFPARLLLVLESAVHEHTSEFQQSLRARKKKKSYVNITIDRTAVSRRSLTYASQFLGPVRHFQELGS
jgi:hypothetical protein